MDGLTTGLRLGLSNNNNNNNNNSTAVSGGGVEIVETEILRAVHAARGDGEGREGKEGRERRENKVLLVLDGLDFLLAATGATAMEMGDLVGSLREV